MKRATNLSKIGLVAFLFLDKTLLFLVLHDILNNCINIQNFKKNISNKIANSYICIIAIHIYIYFYFSNIMYIYKKYS